MQDLEGRLTSQIAKAVAATLNPTVTAAVTAAVEKRLPDVDKNLRDLLAWPSGAANTGKRVKVEFPVLDEDSARIIRNLHSFADFVLRVISEWKFPSPSNNIEEDMAKMLTSSSRSGLLAVICKEYRTLNEIAWADRILLAWFLKPESSVQSDYLDTLRTNWPAVVAGKQGCRGFAKAWLERRLPVIQALAEAFPVEFGNGERNSLQPAMAKYAVGFLSCQESESRDPATVMRLTSQWFQQTTYSTYGLLNCTYQKITLYQDSWLSPAAPPLLKQLKDAVYEFPENAVVRNAPGQPPRGTIIRVSKPVILFRDASTSGFVTEGEIQFYTDRMEVGKG